MRRNLRTLQLLTILSLSLAFLAYAQNDTATTKKDSWDITEVHGPTRDVEFETSEGTWMTVDVSPDGKTIVFDLLGDIYTLPIEGGLARSLTQGPALDIQPRFSPDGKHISFTSDRDGIDNVWIMNSDGSGLKQISKEKERQVNNAVWTPDGQYLIGRKHYRNTRSLGAGEMWMFHSGGGTGLQLTTRRNWQQDAGEPDVSPDGRYLYYSEDITPGGQFQYNKNPYGIIYVIQRLDRETGKTEQYVRGAGGSFRPQISPDGKTLAFVRRVRLSTVLYLYDVESGREKVLFSDLDKDQQEGWAIFGVYPGFSWTPDGKAIVIWAKGRIWRVDAESGAASIIPFRANVKQTITEAVRYTQEVAPSEFDVKMLRWVTVSPDRKKVVYQALGKLWVRDLPQGTPKRLTDDDKNIELYPAFSSDGRWIVYTTWNDDQFGAVYKIRSSGGGKKKLTAEPGTFVEPSFSANGQQVVYRRSGGDNLRGTLFSDDRGIYRMPAEGGTAMLVTERGARPQFTQKGDRIFLIDREDDKVALVSVGLHGEDRRVHFVSENAQEIVPSPDEKWIAFVERYQVFISVFPLTGRAVAFDPATKSYPVKKITRDAGSSLSWAGDSKTLFWSLGPELFSRDVSETFDFANGSGDKNVKEQPDTTGVLIGFQAKGDIPAGTVALVGATIVTMRGDEVIEQGTIIIEGNRIKDVGPASEITVPKNAHRVDVAGHVIIPGLIDVHAHGNFESWTPPTHWRYYANLAYGVTTMHDPSANTETVFSNSESIKAGLMVAPRLFSTGTILYGAEGSYKAIISTFDDALAHLRRLKAVGAFTVKSYNQPRRDQRQMIVEAARKLDMMVVPEGGSTFFWNMTMVLDGNTGIEHNIPIAPLYNDVVTLVANSKTGITPTLIVNYGGLFGEYYWYQNFQVWKNEKLLRFTPREIVDARAIRRDMAEEEDYQYIETSRALKKILDAGGKVQLGAHGQLQGLGAHWELWMLQQGGMTPLEAIRCATLWGAEYIGLDRDLGSLEAGKLADLVVLSRNPLDDIRNTDSVRYVMVNGRIFDADTMNEIGNHPRSRAKFYWER